MTMLTETITWNCEHCDTPVDDGTGYLTVNIGDAEKYQRHLESERQSNELPTVRRLLAYPQPAIWRVVHDLCDRDEEQLEGSRLCTDRGVVKPYNITVADIRTHPQLLWWAGHLFEKGWVHNTNLTDLLQEWGSR